MYLLDTNVLIYFLQGNQKVAEFLNDLVVDCFAISIVTRLEVLIGAKKENIAQSEVEFYLDDCENIILDKAVVNEAVKMASLNKKKLKFKDLVIAATAKVHKKILITSDKDFKSLPGVELLHCS